MAAFEPGGLSGDCLALAGALKARLGELAGPVTPEELESRECVAAGFWPPHSRSVGFGRHEATGSWLACVGNPTGPSVTATPAGELARALLEVYLLEGEEALTGLNAPFAIFLYDGRRGALGAVTDRAGLGRVCHAAAGKAHLLCTSALALAAATGARLRPAGVALYFQLGYLPGTETLFEGIRKVGPARVCSISREGVRERTYWRPPPATRSSGPLEDWSARLAEAGFEAASACLSQGAATTVELTGGLDSRFNLACALATGKPFTAWTIGDVVDRDAGVARELARVRGFEHVVVSPLEALSSHFAAHFERTNRLGDGCSDCLNVISSIAANEAPQPERVQSISGIGGEMFRGRYYAAIDRRRDCVNVERLVRWHLAGNTGYRPELFAPDWADENGRLLAGAVERLLEESSGSPAWWRLQHFYLFGPMQGAAGNSMSFNAFAYRQAAPFCSNRMLELAFAVPPEFRRRSLVLRHAIGKMDADLARVPLDDGAPVLVAGPRGAARALGVRLSRAGALAARAGRRFLSRAGVRQRQDDLYPLVTAGLRDLCDEFLRPGEMAGAALYNTDRLGRFLEHNRRRAFPDRVLTGLMLSMEMTLRYVGADGKLP